MTNQQTNTTTEKMPKKKRPPKINDLAAVERFDVQQNIGLSDEQVESRVEDGLTNQDNSKHGKSIFGIVVSNVCTFFNLIYVVIAIILLVYKQYANMSFMAIVLANTAIAIFQEIRSKKTLDKLKLVNTPTVTVTRNGVQQEISIDEVVLDDVIAIATGNQISCDCIVLDGSIEVNESILTGESDSVVKNVGDTLFAGSIVVAGACVARVDKVGKFNYVASLTSRAKKYEKPRSEMLRTLKAILLFVAIIVVPMAIALWIVNYQAFKVNASWTDHEIFIKTLNKTAGAIISMIPAGPFLLTTVSLAVSVIRLSQKKTIVQELYCIEMLARVDCLCLDKTGTITDGTMKVVESIDLRSKDGKYTIKEIMASFNSAQRDENMTGKALNKFYGKPKNAPLEKVFVLPFSSARKYSAVSFAGQGTYFLGAPEFVLTNKNEQLEETIAKHTSKGLRVLVLAHSATTATSQDKLPTVRRAVALIVIEDKIRKDAAETIKWFKTNGVQVKVISGDNAATVSKIASRVGVENADKYISLEGMTEEEIKKAATKYTVFGRVTPDQKAMLVKALKAAGKTVAMTGDGVNDILAMKESDCAIGLASGSDAARNVAHLIMQDDSFSSLTHVVNEGRRVVNNIQSSTTLYFMKTVYVIVINFVIALLYFVFDTPLATPYETIQIFVLETIIVGLTATILALQPNTQIIKGKFFTNIIKRCLPASLTFLVTTASIYIVAECVPDIAMSPDQLSTLMAITYTIGGYYALFYACKPFNGWKRALYIGIGVISALLILLMPNAWGYEHLEPAQILLLITEAFAAWSILKGFMYLFSLKGKNSTK